MPASVERVRSTANRASATSASDANLAVSSLVFIDPSIPDYQQLAEGVIPDTKVYLLHPAADAITQITQILQGCCGIESLHIVSHGEAGGLQFGSGAVNLTNLAQYADQLQSWQRALTPGADILLYGCNVAQGEVGQTFVQLFSHLTGADIAASDDLTGNAALGGNWTLGYHTGGIEAELGFTQSSRDAYTGILPFAAPITVGVGSSPYGITTGDFNGDGKVDFAATNYNSGPLSILITKQKDFQQFCQSIRELTLDWINPQNRRPQFSFCDNETTLPTLKSGGVRVQSPPDLGDLGGEFPRNCLMSVPFD